jgi:hypothetical protein
MNIPILNRIQEMFDAEKPKCYNGDPIKSYLFSCITEDILSKLSVNVEIADAIEEIQTYIFRDRPLQVNDIIKAELNGDYENMSEFTEDLYRQDTAVLCNIVKIRNYIYA